MSERTVRLPRPVHAEGPPDLRTVAEEIENCRRNANVRAVEAVRPAVVSITVTEIREYASRFRDPLFELFFPDMRRIVRRPVQSIGSGFIITQDGYILTNQHVIEDADEIVVNLSDGRQFQVEDVRKEVIADPELDISVIKIDEENLPVAQMGDSDDAIIGEWAIAIGNPFGYLMKDPNPTVSVGVISAVRRDFGPQGDRVYRDMIQTDTAINPGNSGGPLVNCLGEVIGINTFIFTGSQGDPTSIGIGFAIPINRAKKVLDEIFEYGKIRRPWPGVYVQDLDRWIARSLGLDSTNGVIVTKIDPKSPGEKARLEVGDVIVRINGESIRDRRKAAEAFLGATVGDVFELEVIRDGRTITTQLKLEAEPNERK